jgi:hypothetical protein
MLVRSAGLLILLIAPGCATISSHSGERQTHVEVTVEQQEYLDKFESLIPISPDRVADLYAQCPPDSFGVRYRDYMNFVSTLVDSFNRTIPNPYSIDTLCICHAIENFADAGRSGHTLFISSSYFLLFNDKHILRSLLTHEFGHIHYLLLDSARTRQIGSVWAYFRESALFYLFRDGEYSANARFGGHPEESPSELFASAYNLLRNEPQELHARLGYVASEHSAVLAQMLHLVSQ